jgi:hypothetical protein
MGLVSQSPQHIYSGFVGWHGCGADDNGCRSVNCGEGERKLKQNDVNNNLKSLKCYVNDIELFFEPT